MSAPSPYYTAQAIGNNIAAGIRNYKDRTAIDEILESANATGKPEDIDFAMTQILSRVSPEKQQMALAILQKKKADIEQKNNKKAYKDALNAQGYDPNIADQPESIQKEYFKRISSSRERSRKEDDYEQAGLPRHYAGLDPTTQRTLVQGKQNQDFFDQISRGISPQSADQIDPSQGMNGSPNIRVINGVPSILVSPEEASARGFPQEPQDSQAPIDMTDTLDKFSPAPQPVQKKPIGMEGFSDQQLVAMSGLKGPAGQMAKSELQRRQEAAKIEQRNTDNKAKRHESISQKTMERAEAIAETLPQKRSAQRLMNDAIARKDLSFWSWDNLAELTGIEGLRSPEGALFKTAGKEYFLGSISRAGARPNQWIEQQISDMMTKVGRSTEANLSVSRALENELDLDEKRVELTREISKDLENKLGYVPRDLGERVDKQLKVFAERKQKELFNDLRAIKAIGENKSESFMKVEAGTPISKLVANALLKKNNNDPKKAREEAKQLGYSF